MGLTGSGQIAVLFNAPLGREHNKCVLILVPWLNMTLPAFAAERGLQAS